jgi:hypothetical protein
MVVYIDTSKMKWSFFTSHPWAHFIDIPSKSRRRLNKRPNIWAWEHLIAKERKERPPPTKKRKKKIWTTSGKPFQAARK